MANNQFSFTSYAEVQTYDAKAGGPQIYGNGFSGPVYKSFPVVGTSVTGLSPAVVITTAWGQVTANSIVEIFPTGLATPGFTKKYLCDATEATLATART